MNYILFAGLLQIILTIAFIVMRMEKHKANYLLTLLALSIGIHLAAKLYIFSAVDNPNVIFRMHTGIQLAYGPLLYLFTRKRNDESFTTSKMWYLFIPLIMVITLYACTSLAIAAYPGQGTSILKFYNSVVFLPIVSSHIIFAILSRSSKTLTTNNIYLINGLRYILVALGISEIALLALGNINPSLNPYIRCIIYVLLDAVPVIIFWFGQPLTINKIPAASENQNSIVRKQILPEIKHEEIFSQLEALLKQNQLYKDEDLSLEKLSAASGISRHNISETLNVFAKKSFYRYINEYRIKEVLQQLDTKNSKRTKLLSVAYDCGFKNKASFNQYFKDIVGTTPSAYIKEKAA